jgi:hypothetical protein
MSEDILATRALQIAERLDFGWRSVFSAAIRPFLLPRALAAEAISTQMIAPATTQPHSSGSAWNERHSTCI